MSAVQKKIAKHILLPGLWPRIKALFGTGFFHIAYLIASIYAGVGLLPLDHPYLNPENRGRFGVRHVIAAAAENLRFSRRNLDQIFVFFTLLVGLVIIVLQIILFGTALFSEQYVLAQTSPPEFPGAIRHVLFESWYYNPGPGQDFAFILLDKIFGTSGSTPGNLIFGSCISDTTITCQDMNDQDLPTEAYPYPMHAALHNLLEFYTRGLFFVAVWVLIYFVVAMVAETAASGTPFGQRTNRLWMPLRIIAFFFLLIPLNSAHASGLNMAQMITFWTAKIGSNFATNAWGYFTAEVFQNDETYAGKKNKLIATPKVPDVNTILQFMYVVRTCKVATEAMYGDKVQAATNDHGHDGIQAYIVRPPGNYKVQPGNLEPLRLDQVDFDQVRKYVDFGSINFVFGIRDTHADADTRYSQHSGNVYPHCGEMILTLNTMGIPPNLLNGNNNASPQSLQLTGISKIQKVYFDMIQDIWKGTSFDYLPYATCEARRDLPVDNDPNCTPVLDNSQMIAVSNFWTDKLKAAIQAAIDEEIARSEQWDVPDALKKKGWAGAGVWFNRIAQINGDITGAVLKKPVPTKYPAVMEAVVEARRVENEGSATEDLFNPSVDDGAIIKYPFEQQLDGPIARTLYGAYRKWTNDSVLRNQFERNDQGSILVRAVHLLLGAGGIYDMRENADIHPMAQLSALGKSMMEASARNIGAGLAATGAQKLMGGDLGAFAKTLGSFMSVFGFATLAMSFIMFYILPMLPFIYFFFAVAGWVKSIFEAIVAMPLWALAHVRIDGDGLPGQYAIGGYYLLFEIFLRPVLIIFGLIASIIIFTALVQELNEIFSLVVSNIAGFNIEAENAANPQQSLSDFMRGPIDQFVYTVVYAIIVFLLGQSCFKLIDLIPNQILRWAGNPVKTFQESAGDPAGDAMSMTYKGIQLGTGQIQGGALATFF